MKPRTTVADRLGEHLRPTGQESSLDITFPDERVRFQISPRLALAAAGVVAVLMGLIIAWSLFGAGGGAGPHSGVGTGSPPGEAESGSFGVGQLPEVAAAAAGEPGGDMVVSVVGAVVEPGLATLAPGARVADAIAASGGLTAAANPMALNQAQLVVDGQQVVVPEVGAGGGVGVGDPGEGAGDGLVSLNSATVTELTTLDGVGEATAAAILEHRQQIGGFTTIEQLLDVSGIGPAKFASLKEQVTL